MANTIIKLDTETSKAIIVKVKNGKTKDISAALAMYILGKTDRETSLEFQGVEQHYVVTFDIDKKELKALRKEFISSEETQLKEKKLMKILSSDDCATLLPDLMASKLNKKEAKKVAKTIINTVDDSDDEDYED